MGEDLKKSLDLGSGEFPRNPFNAEELFGVDIVKFKSKNVLQSDLVINPIPFSDSSFDYVTAYDFLEHIPRLLYYKKKRVQPFIELMNEVWRVLKPGGTCCILAPAAGYEHKVPVDCWRFYPDGFTAIAKFADLEVLHVSTQWDSLNYPDGSDQWKDSILVCRKPISQNLRSQARSALRHKLLSFALKM